MATEKRLIDANELSQCKFTKPVQSFYAKGWNDAIDAVRENAPTVDAVEVVRCEACEFCSYNSSNDTYKCRAMRGMYRAVDPTEFCSWGERKDNAKETV